MIKNIKQKIKNFVLTNYVTRRVKLFFHQSFVPTILKSLLFTLALLLLSFALLKVFKPQYLNNIYNKSAFYFYHYLKLDNDDFKEINISGNLHVQKIQIIDIVNNAKRVRKADGSLNYEAFIVNLINELKTKIPWIDQITIMRNMPDILNITITEYKPFAVWQDGGNKYFTDKEGNLVPYENLEEFDHMVILSGKGANKNAKSLFNIFAIDPLFSANVYSATWISQRRWDIRLADGLLIKLPEKNIADAWHRLIKLYNTKGSTIGLKLIDLRILDKIYLEYEESVVKELKKVSAPDF